MCKHSGVVGGRHPEVVAGGRLHRSEVRFISPGGNGNEKWEAGDGSCLGLGTDLGGEWFESRVRGGG